MQSEEIRERFLKFFESRGHAIIPSASLVPENDPSVLFTTAGMQPLVPYLLGQKHPSGTRLVNVQKCVRTQDIEEVGDNTHDTFFEMLGNWSLGDYFKEDTIKWSYEFLTNGDDEPEGDKGLGLKPERLYVTVFEGDENAPRDDESVEIWKSLGVPEHRIYFQGAKDNWWSPGDNGPCGPDTEMFYDVTKEGLGDMSFEEFKKADELQSVVEVWNDVFMEYEKKDGKIIGKLEQKNVDTGAGLERLAMVMQGKDNIFDTDLFTPIVEKIKEHTKSNDTKGVRIIADHIRTAIFMILDGVTPSNTDRGYILRRLIRRARYYYNSIGGQDKALGEFVHIIGNIYKETKYKIQDKIEEIDRVITAEEQKFFGTILYGKRLLEKIIQKEKHVSGENAFNLFSTYGFPIEMTKEIAEENDIKVDEKGFHEEMKKHQKLSRKGAEQKFKGGLADSSEITTMLHTATHLMLAGLRKYLGNGVHQAGSNITEERLRFDFTHPEKVDRETLGKVEEYVNEAIGKKCDVVMEQMPKEEAQKTGVEGSFWEKYPEVVTVYCVKCEDGTIYSQELCGGPHVKNTEDINGVFKIKKEESSSAGVRRVKAILE